MANTEHRGKLEIEIDNQKEKLKNIKTNYTTFRTLEKKKKELSDIEKSWFFIRWIYSGFKQELQDSVSEIEKKIKDKHITEPTGTQIAELTNRIRELEDAQQKKMVNAIWRGFPERLDESIQEKYLQKFRKLPQTIDEEVEFVNITMIGGIGVGKTSFLNTVVTALMNTTNAIYRDYKTAPYTHGQSKTKTFQLDKIKVEGKKDIPIRFYDCPGIDGDEDRTMTVDVLEAVIKGHVKPDSTFNPREIRDQDGNGYRRDPAFKHVMHCIIFVIPATTDVFGNHEAALSKIKALQQRINGPRDVVQVAIVTNIDQIDIPDVDIESVFKYPKVKLLCERVSKFLEIEKRFVYPVANYDEDTEPDAAKNALSLMALWDIFEKGERHIRRKLETGFHDDY